MMRDNVLVTDCINKATTILKAATAVENNITAGIVLLQSLDELKQTLESDEASTEYKAAAIDLSIAIIDNLTVGLEKYAEKLVNGL